MGDKNEDKLNIVDHYLKASCFNKISKSILKEILDSEVKADPTEKKLIKKIKDQIKLGKISLTMNEAMKT